MEVTVGAFMFMVLLALGVFTIVLSRQSLFTTTYYMDIRFPEVLGVREGDNVYLRGVAVGKVRRIQALEDVREVVVAVALNQKVTLREDYRVDILPSSVLGGRYVNIFEGTDQAPPRPPGAPVHGERPVDLVDQATRTVEMIRSALDEGGLLNDMRVAMANVNEVTTRLKQGQGTIGRLLADDAVYRDLEAVAANLKRVSDDLAGGRGTLGRLLADDGTVYEDVRAAAADLRTVSARLAEGKGLAGKLLSDSDDDTFYEDLRAVARSLRTLSARLERGEGTLGRLLSDPGLYEEANLLVREARATVDDLRETAPITTLTSVLFGAF